ncbi:carbamoyltransferase family protein [Chitinophaga pinensis]|uniref:Carbamoyltransferase n=1 Tax=Chitinophaga pinensis (strain ATCC 43595 / DSM 2588 / LMG 13176 / NBRC 15968 / NCIMB 11800 / UQM 2034) TaxID=485918 RepID=A0A979G869_CHIPD|nr:carbamoyltransferase C-terminal domain-containing protein [Chitinophaga pinensis]ACU62472.1 Carbamoyltransferase [Chitinophaga pinensis DSM 2588]
MYTLGINAAFHDSAACLVKDGQLIAAAEDERFTHVKHGKRPIPFSAYELPYHAIDYCLKTANIHLSDVDHISYSFDPFILLPEEDAAKSLIDIPLRQPSQFVPEKWVSPWDPLFLSAIINAPGQLTDGYPHHLQQRFRGARFNDDQWHFVEHHLCHAASAFLPSPYHEAAVLTIDGRGEKATTTFSMGKGNDLQRLSQVDMPHSLGLLYEKVTTHLGFLHSSDEYKVMALASYGKPVFVNAFRSMINMLDNGQYAIQDERMVELLGPARKKGDEFTAHHFNIAHSLQAVLQESVLQLTDWLYKETQADNLCFAGGVALNCVLNAKIRDAGIFKNIWVQPASGDAGTALGAALWTDAKERGSQEKTFHMDHAYWGPEYGDDEIKAFLDWTKTPYTKLENVAEETAALLAQDKIIGWYQGRMEFGPRALGSRSILASPISADMQARLNEVKDREDFRPVAPVVLEDVAAEWFEDAHFSPFMLFVYNVKEDKKDKIPAVTHVDGTARIQTINRDQHPRYYDLLQAFYKQTGVPVLINTSFNTLGKPIVCTPRDAVECFWSSPFDALVIGSFLVQK